jgi:hypothetical protein
MDPLADFAQLQLPFVDQVQWRYEVIRPIVLFDDQTAVQRAVETHTHPETVRKLTRRFPDSTGFCGKIQPIDIVGFIL